MSNPNPGRGVNTRDNMGLPGGLPNLEFFRPTEDGLAWLVAFLKDKPQPLFEVGAGTGLLSHLLWERGIKIVPMDVAPRENPHTLVMIADATEHPFPEGSWLVVARPCHGSFVSGLVENAKACRCAGILYIGKEENLEDDLDSIRNERQTWDGCDGPLGEDGEHAWIVPIHRPLQKSGALKACVVADPMGTTLASPEEEAYEIQEGFEEALGVPLSVTLVNSPYEIPEGTAVVFYDFGGMVGCSGLVEDNSREVIRWAQDHPSSLVVIVSEFTYRRFIERELESLGLTPATGEGRDAVGLHNLVVRDFGADHLGVPEWFLALAKKDSERK